MERVDVLELEQALRKYGRCEIGGDAKGRSKIYRAARRIGVRVTTTQEVRNGTYWYIGKIVS